MKRKRWDDAPQSGGSHHMNGNGMGHRASSASSLSNFDDVVMVAYASLRRTNISSRSVVAVDFDNIPFNRTTPS